MDKIAQRRSLLNKIKEKANIGGIAAEKFFNPEFERVMEKLREFDSNLRSIAVGESVDGGDPGKDPADLKNLLKEAESNFNRREYITAVAYLGRFHKKLSELVENIDSLDMDVTKVHKDFLFKELGDDQKNILREMNKRFSSKIGKESFITNAGIMDFLHNIGTTRGRALAAWEKRYPKQVKKLKKDTQNLLNKSENILNTLLNDFAKLADYRAKRQVDDYMKTVFKFKALFSTYHQIFNTYYVENVKSFLNSDDFLDPPAPIQEQVIEQKQPLNVAVNPVIPAPPKVVNKPTEIEDEKSLLHNDFAEKEKENEFTPQWIDVTYDRFGRKLNPKTNLLEEEDVTDFADKIDSNKSLTDSDLLRQLAPSNLSDLNDPLDYSPKTTEDIDAEADTENPITNRSSHNKFYNQLMTLSNESSIIQAKYIYKYAKSIEIIDPVVSKQLLNLYNEIMV